MTTYWYGTRGFWTGEYYRGWFYIYHHLLTEFFIWMLLVRVVTGEEERIFLQVKALFVGREVLDLLAQHGVPETYVDLPTATITSAYEADQIERLEGEFSTE